MARGIIVFGASGSGTTTIGKELAKITGYKHFDLDDYYWNWDTQIPYTVPRPKIERIELLQKDISECNYFVMSGSICGWDDSFISLFDLGIFVQTPTDIRIERLINRELKEFGDRIQKGGDMYEGHIDFVKWAKSYDNASPPERCLKLHEKWSDSLNCPVLRINGIYDLSENIKFIMERFVPQLPDELNELLSEYDCIKNSVGWSSASVYLFHKGDNAFYLKINKSSELIRERDIMIWLKGKVPVPQVKYFGEKNNLYYLLMTASEGHMSCDFSEDIVRESYENTVRLLADGILMLQSIDITDCPFVNTLDIMLKDALFNIEYGLVDMEDFEDGNEFTTPMELYNYLIQNKPTEENCFCHGDYCLPNIFIDDNKVTGFIDLGSSGIADKWQDIALCVRSLEYNLKNVDKTKYIDLLFEHLNIEPNWDKINYYILLDELF